MANPRSVAIVVANIYAGLRGAGQMEETDGMRKNFKFSRFSIFCQFLFFVRSPEHCDIYFIISMNILV